MNATTNCQSCGMPIAFGSYCQFCVDENGDLQRFDERLKCMSQCMLDHEQATTPEEAEQKALAYMATMPAWRDHPRITGREQP